MAERTKQCYGAWAARYAVFAGGEREVMQVATAARFLTSVVEDEDCAYSMQKQALNALAHFFKYVCGVEDPVFDVRLRVTCHRFPTGRHVGQWESSDMSAQSMIEGGPIKEWRIASGCAGCALRLMKTRYRSPCIPIRNADDVPMS